MLIFPNITLAQTYTEDLKTLTNALIVIKNSLSSIVFVLAIAAIITVGISSLYGNFNWKWLWSIIAAMLMLHLTDLVLSYASGTPVQELGCVHNCGTGTSLRGPGQRARHGGNHQCHPGMGGC